MYHPNIISKSSVDLGINKPEILFTQMNEMPKCIILCTLRIIMYTLSVITYTLSVPLLSIY